MTTPAVALISGWLADRAVGEPPHAHPVAAFGRLAETVERRWWRDDHLAGAAYVAALVAVPTALAGLADRCLAARPGWRAAVLGGVLAVSIGGRSLGTEARAVGSAVGAGDLDAARERLPALCGRDPAALDAAGLCRAAVESVAENTSDAVVAPLWWAAVAGTPGVVAHRTANTLDAMVGNRSTRHRRFGATAARLDDALGYVPARLTAAVLAAAAPLAGGSPRAALAAWARDGARHDSPNAGRCEAAMAGALGVALGGAATYADDAARAPTGPFGDGDAPAADDVDRAVRLSLAAGAVATVLCAALAVARVAASTRWATPPTDPPTAPAPAPATDSATAPATGNVGARP